MLNQIVDSALDGNQAPTWIWNRVITQAEIDDFEHIQAISVGVGATYMLQLNQKNIESCPQKYEIFRTIRTWEDARKANAFPRSVKKLLADTERDWTLEQGSTEDNWNLYELVNGEKIQAHHLTRTEGY